MTKEQDANFKFKPEIIFEDLSLALSSKKETGSPLFSLATRWSIVDALTNSWSECYGKIDGGGFLKPEEFKKFNWHSDWDECFELKDANFRTFVPRTRYWSSAALKQWKENKEEKSKSLSKNLHLEHVVPRSWLRVFLGVEASQTGCTSALMRNEEINPERIRMILEKFCFTAVIAKREQEELDGLDFESNASKRKLKFYMPHEVNAENWEKSDPWSRYKILKSKINDFVIHDLVRHCYIDFTSDSIHEWLASPGKFEIPEFRNNETYK